MTTRTLTDPAPTPAPKGRTLKAAVQDRWTELTAPGTFLDRRRGDLVEALDHGWRAGPAWVRLLAVLLITMVVIGGAVVLDTLAQELLTRTEAAARVVGIADTLTGVHRYLGQHTVDLSISGTGAYTAWKATGLVAALLSCTLGSAVARLAWISWSGATLAIVWQASPDSGRTVATGLAAAVIAAASIPALRGLAVSPRPQATVHRTVHQVAVAVVAQHPAPPRTAVQRPSGPFDLF